jgi:hypothetical protein
MLAIWWTNVKFGTRGGADDWGTVVLAGREPVRFPMVSLQLLIDIIFPVALRPLSRLNLLTELSTRDTSLRVKAAGA